MRKHHHVVWELVLVMGSILMFRSAWTLMDRYAWFSETVSLAVLLVLGAVASGIAFYVLSHDEE